jgi:hypothetical protein
MRITKLLTGLLLFFLAMPTLAETNRVAGAESAPAPAEEDRIMELLTSGSDPFRLERSGGTDTAASNLGQMDVTRITSVVAVKGILSLEGSDPRSMIAVGGGSVQMVVRDDLILLPTPAQGVKPVKGVGAVSAPKTKYLIVREITRDSVIVAPEQRPQEMIKIQ